MSRRRIQPRIARLVGTASLLALLPLTAAAGAPASAGSEFSAPTGPLVLTRTLRRPLSDGAEIVSTRSYEVTIVPDEHGYRVEGRLLSTEVTAPASLAALAEIERKRADSGLFPLRLDRNGMIAAGGAPADRGASAAAAAVGRAAMASSALAGPDRREAQSVIEQLTVRGSAPGARWPSDLFHPAPGHHNQVSRFEIPGGETGSVTTTVETRRAASTHSIERTVVTEAGGARRATYETYTVSPREG